MTQSFNLEREYGWFLDGIFDYVENNPDEFLAHFGVKGMKWGVRNGAKRTSADLKGLGPDTITRTTANGDSLTMSKSPPSAVHKVLNKFSKNYANNYNRLASLSITDSTGKKIGDATVHKKDNGDLDLVWLGINRDSRGKGYATAAMKTAEEFGRQSGAKKMTLEVPGNSPDARHIYEKLGFKVVKEADPADIDDGVWGGLTEMEYTFDEVRQMDASSSTLAHESVVSGFLAHYGVKGMKWGVSRSGSGGVSVSSVRASAAKGVSDARDRVKKEVAERTSTETTVRAKPGSAVQVVGGNKRKPHEDAVQARIAEQIAKRNTLDALSNKELGNLVQRMNLEQQYRNLAVKEDRRSAGEKLVQKVVKDNGSQLVASLSGTTQSVAQQALNFVSNVGQNKALSNGVPNKGEKKS